MRLLFKGKDGGPESNVTGYWLIEAKGLFSFVLLRFDKGSREAYHSHAFNAWSWKLVYTSRERMHKVYGMSDRTWVLSFRGPWADKWQEFFDKTRKFVTLTHGRKVVE